MILISQLQFPNEVYVYAHTSKCWGQACPICGGVTFLPNWFLQTHCFISSPIYPFLKPDTLPVPGHDPFHYWSLASVKSSLLVLIYWVFYWRACVLSANQGEIKERAQYLWFWRFYSTLQWIPLLCQKQAGGKRLSDVTHNCFQEWILLCCCPPIISVVWEAEAGRTQI